jgi:hypothetical protein
MHYAEFWSHRKNGRGWHSWSAVYSRFWKICWTRSTTFSICISVVPNYNIHYNNNLLLKYKLGKYFEHQTIQHLNDLLLLICIIIVGYNRNTIWICRWPSEEKELSKINFHDWTKYILYYIFFIYIFALHAIIRYIAEFLMQYSCIYHYYRLLSKNEKNPQNLNIEILIQKRPSHCIKQIFKIKSKQIFQNLE